MKAIERHRQTWVGKSDEWLFERLDNELKQKVDEIHKLLTEKEELEKALTREKNKQLVLFAEWLQYNGKWDLPKKQVKDFLKKQKK